MVKLSLTTAHLLSDHDNAGSLNCTPVSWNCKQFEEASEEVVSLCEPLLFDEHFFSNQLSVDVIEIPSRLERGGPKPQQGLVGFVVLVLLHKPARRFGTEPDPEY